MPNDGTLTCTESTTTFVIDTPAAPTKHPEKVADLKHASAAKPTVAPKPAADIQSNSDGACDSCLLDGEPAIHFAPETARSGQTECQCSFEPKPIPELVFIIPLTKLSILVSVKAESSGNMSDSETCMVKTFCKLIGVATKMANHPVTALSLVVKRTARGERDKLCQFPKSSKKSETQNPAVSKDIAKDFIAYSYGVFHSSKDQKDKAAQPETENKLSTSMLECINQHIKNLEEGVKNAAEEETMIAEFSKPPSCWPTRRPNPRRRSASSRSL
ncbi:hypothetical protein PC123_g2314 [Phytophthora cactorum]|nr:hypothetical protein PC123_g2314 [Phytophthora cactorum]